MFLSKSCINHPIQLTQNHKPRRMTNLMCDWSIHPHSFFCFCQLQPVLHNCSIYGNEGGLLLTFLLKISSPYLLEDIKLSGILPMKTAVDLWSNIIAMELPSSHIPSHALGRDFNSQVLKHREFWSMLPPPPPILMNKTGTSNCS